MSKSEELAKLLGIKPQIDDKMVCTAMSFQKIKSCKQCEYQCKHKIYPDFTEPSNFVKLIELKISDKSTVGRYLQGSGTYGVPFSNQWYDRESFLNILIEYLSRTDECFSRNRNKIINKAQKTEWSY